MKPFNFFNQITHKLSPVFFISIILLLPTPGFGQDGISSTIGLSPDPGYPIWLTPDPDNYLPLRTNQTSGMDWVATDLDENGNIRHWLIIADDGNEGGIHLISLLAGDDPPKVRFHTSNLTLPPLDISLLPINPAVGYDWEAIALHQWSGTVFIAQEGTLDDIAIYHGHVSPGDKYPGETAFNRSGPVEILPGYFTNVKQLNLPGWDETFGESFQENLGIEGVACSEDRLLMGLESPFTNTQRFLSVTSTTLAIWKINPDDPSDMENCELLATHDTSEWSEALGCTIETICGLDAIDSTHVVGLDRDNKRLFAIEFTQSGEFVRGRIIYLDTPGPAPLPSDNCPPLDDLPSIILPSLESVALVPGGMPDSDAMPESYYIYLVVDPWALSWKLSEREWECPQYEQRLNNLLPALYRYSIRTDLLFPDLAP